MLPSVTWLSGAMDGSNGVIIGDHSNYGLDLAYLHTLMPTNNTHEMELGSSRSGWKWFK